MSHKDAKPLSIDQQMFEQWWRKRAGAGIAFGRDRHSEYFSEFTRDAWAAWKAAQEYGRNQYRRQLAEA